MYEEKNKLFSAAHSLRLQITLYAYLCLLLGGEHKTLLNVTHLDGMLHMFRSKPHHYFLGPYFTLKITTANA